MFMRDNEKAGKDILSTSHEPAVFNSALNVGGSSLLVLGRSVLCRSAFCPLSLTHTATSLTWCLSTVAYCSKSSFMPL